MRPVVLVAASGLAREVAAALELLGTPVLGCLDDDEALWGTRVGALAVLGGLDRLPADADVVVCAGKGAARRAIVERLDLPVERYATVVHPSVSVPSTCTIGVGSILLAQVVLTSDVTIGAHVVVMPQCTLTHDVVLDDFATLTAGVSLAGHVHVGEAAYVGMNASVRERVSVAPGGVIGMGAALLHDTAPDEVWVGVPARRHEGAR